MHEHDPVKPRQHKSAQFNDPSVDHVSGDRSDVNTLREAARAAEPDLVVDAAFYPSDVLAVTNVFADVESYVYVSTGGTYSAHEIPKREDETPLYDCTPDQAVSGADGCNSFIARAVDAEIEESTPGIRALYYRYVRDFESPTDGPSDGAEFSYLGDQVAYVFPSDDGVTCLSTSHAIVGSQIGTQMPPWPAR